MRSKQTVRFKRAFLIAGVAAATLVAMAPLARSYTLTSGHLVEDFTSVEKADFAASTGLWNIVDHVAQAAVVANADTARPISFGDGSDGVLDTTAGFTFNTDSHPNGYNFISVNLSGPITVVGSNPLIIRSLSTMTIGTAITLDGQDGADGTVGSGAGTAPGGAAGVSAPTCASSGGTGGASSTALSVDGVQGYWNGVFDSAVSAGFHDNVGGPITPPVGSMLGADFDAGQFGCYAGGAGGGGLSGATYASGGGGGGAGGAIRFIAVGNMTLAAISAKGGAGGRGLDVGGAVCGGYGRGGGSGIVWVQSFKTVTAPAPVTDLQTKATLGVGVDCGVGFAGNGYADNYRGDQGAGNPAGWAAYGYTTGSAAANQTYYVYSKPYDLHVLNARFSAAPTIASTIAGAATVSVAFAGSSDGSNFSDFTTDLTSLSDKNYRYLKFRATLTTDTVAGASPTISQIALDYEDLGLEKLTGSLTLGCGSLQTWNQNDKGPGPTAPAQGLAYLATLFLLWLTGYSALRRRA